MNVVEPPPSRATRVPGNLTRQLANRAMGRDDLIALWFGEPDVPTPEFICQAATEALARGETFYTEGLGRNYLRQGIADYLSRTHRVDMSAERIAVTVSAGNALNLAFQCLLNEGDTVVTTCPAFPNLLSIPAMQGAVVRTVPLQATEAGWQLDMEQLLHVARGAKVILINSPNNPTGWMMPRQQMQQLIQACRANGTWLLSDEVYSRLCFDGQAAPSLLEFAEDEERLIVVNSFSKAWAMTGWRLGWLTMPRSLMPTLERIMEFSVSCAPAFAQRAGAVALSQGEAFIRSQNERYARNLALVQSRFAAMPRIEFPTPQATFYAYFRIAGVSDNLQFAQRLIDEANVGIAPGIAFDPQAKDWYRICFAKSAERLSQGLDRIEACL
ncbi:MAG: pyridoxal phosphate-dependent aminotransferase [Planctomycetales bacterium]|nr:pyridoxal phosphate-dependent aminotransferase [Planctomycetales bacterium]